MILPVLLQNHQFVLTFGLISGAILSAIMLVTIPFQDAILIKSGEAGKVIFEVGDPEGTHYA